MTGQATFVFDEKTGEMRLDEPRAPARRSRKAAPQPVAAPRVPSPEAPAPLDETQRSALALVLRAARARLAQPGAWQNRVADTASEWAYGRRGDAWILALADVVEPMDTVTLDGALMLAARAVSPDPADAERLQSLAWVACCEAHGRLRHPTWPAALVDWEERTVAHVGHVLACLDNALALTTTEAP